MKKLYLMLFFGSAILAEQYTIGLCIMATGKYSQYAERLIESARKYFFVEDNVRYYVFTDQQLQHPAPDIITIHQNRLGWPHDTLMRSHIYETHKEQLQCCDYIFALDADMLFVDHVGREILSERVATLHPGFVGRRGSYETNRHSTAYVPHKEGRYYFAGGFYGGQRDEFFRMISVINQRIDKDLSKNFIAVWHDESQWNRFCIDYPPTKILNPSYCYPESGNYPNFKRKIIALDKNHAEMRN